jgi:hypothetical protein
MEKKVSADQPREWLGNSLPLEPMMEERYTEVNWNARSKTGQMINKMRFVLPETQKSLF